MTTTSTSVERVFLGALAESVEMEVYRCLSLSDLALLKRTSRLVQLRVEWFAKGHYSGRIDLVTGSKRRDQHYLGFIAALLTNCRHLKVNPEQVDDLVHSWLSSSVLKPHKPHKPHSLNIERLEILGPACSLVRIMAMLKLPKLGSLVINAFNSHPDLTTAVCKFLTIHSHITELRIHSYNPVHSTSILSACPGTKLLLALKTLAIVLNSTSQIEPVVKHYSSTLTNLSVTFREEEATVTALRREPLTPLLLKQCEGLTRLTSLGLVLHVADLDSSSVTWKAPSSLVSLTIRGSPMSLPFPRIQSNTLQRLELSHVDWRPFRTISTDCPSLSYFHLDGLFAGDVDDDKQVSVIDKDEVSLLPPGDVVIDRLHPRPLHTLVCKDYTHCNLVPKLLGEQSTRPCIGSYLGLRILEVTCDRDHASSSSAANPSSLTSYFRAITIACPGLESLAITFHRFGGEDTLEQSTSTLFTTSTKRGIGDAGHVMTRLSRLKVMGLVIDPLHYERAFYLDLAQLCLDGYSFPVLPSLFCNHLH